MEDMGEEERERRGQKGKGWGGGERGSWRGKQQGIEERERGGWALSTGFLGYGRSQGTFQTHLNFGEDGPFNSACGQSTTSLNNKLESSTTQVRVQSSRRSLTSSDMNWSRTRSASVCGSKTENAKIRCETGKHECAQILVMTGVEEPYLSKGQSWHGSLTSYSSYVKLLLAAFPLYLSDLKG